MAPRQASAVIQLASLLVLLVKFGNAQVIHVGKCPAVTVLEDFFPPFYLGRWFEIASYPAVFEAETTCAADNYLPLGGLILKVNNTATDSSGKVTFAVGVASPPDISVPAKMLITFPQFPKPTPYWILDTDYENYALVYSCTAVGFMRTEFVWILSRTPTLDPTFRAMATNVLTSNQIDISPLKDTVQENCANY